MDDCGRFERCADSDLHCVDAADVRARKLNCAFVLSVHRLAECQVDFKSERLSVCFQVLGHRLIHLNLEGLVFQLRGIDFVGNNFIQKLNEVNELGVDLKL